MEQNLVLYSHAVPVVFILSLLLQGTPVFAGDRSYAGHLEVSPLTSVLTAISEEQ
jgi:hypothetical protein